jgi:outer membrane receptor protein involved in Fe transport
MSLAEAGVKFAAPKVQVYATGFWTQYNNVGFTNYVFNPVTSSVTQQSAYANTRTIGVELESRWQPLRWFDISAIATIEDPKYQGLIYTDAAKVVHNFDGNQLIRVPKVSLRITPALNLLDDRLRVQASIEYEGQRYVDTANSVVLPAYTAVNLSARFAVTPQLSLFGYVDNVTNSLGLTEGNPRAGEVQSTDAGANAFIARPLLGRNFRMSILFKY